MIVVDASALVAILLAEADASSFEQVLLKAGQAIISPVNHWELLVRAYANGGDAGRREAEQLLIDFNISIGQIDAAISRAADAAFARFGRRTPAGLNLGDCFAYALAQSEGDGLLYKGEDFARTDIVSALDLEP